MKLDVMITKTSNGLLDYIQILSDDTITVNITLVVEEIKVQDFREKKNEKERG